MSDFRRIIWLASFPKSGNTWVRAVLAHYFRPPDHELGINSLGQFTLSDTRQEFYDQAAGAPFRGQSVEDWVAVRGKAMELLAAAKPGTHFVKTHSQPGIIGGIHLIPPAVTAAAIYVLRNPFDIAPSYARHMGLSLDEVIARMTDNRSTHATENGIYEVIGRWDTHLANWMTQTHGLPKHVMRYEDMVADDRRAFGALFAFLKVAPDSGRLGKALTAASFRALQQQEQAEGFRERPPHMDRFFRTGRAGGWRAALTPGQVARIRDAFLPALEKHYPELLDQTAEFARGTAV